MKRLTRSIAVSAGALLALSGCGFSPYDLPLPGGADTGDKPFTITADFRDVLDLVPQSGVRVNDLAVGRVTDIKLDGWNAEVTLEVNGDVDLPDNARATIRQTSLLGEKFVSLEAPSTGGAGRLSNGDHIPLDRSGRNPEIEEVFSAASLLFNGGGLERTNTIVKELNQTLGGNEPEIKELLGSTEEFLGQLDDNKEALLTSLEKVNRLAIATNEQTDAITGALDDLPDALRVVNDQRDDLVTLLQALDRLSGVATGVIQESKADTVASLKALTPTLRNLATASDDFAYDFKALLSFPFTDGTVGNTVARATGKCPVPDGTSGKNKGYCTGDYANLSIQLDLEAEQVTNLLKGLGLDLGDLSSGLAPGSGTTNTPSSASGDDAAADDVQAQLNSLMAQFEDVPGIGDLLKNPLTGGTGTTSGGAGGTTPSTPKVPTPGAPAATTPAPTESRGLLCSLFGSCRTAVASSGATSESAAGDFRSVMLRPVEEAS